MKKIALLALIALASCEPNAAFHIIPSASAAVPDQVLKLALSQAVPGVVWSATAGTITQAGVFTAPPCSTSLPQTITVTAVAGPLSATATVAVADAVTGITINPPTASLPPLGTVTFTATVKSLCNPTGTASVLRVTAPAALKAVKK
jgi:hypothetical protein